MLLVPIYLLEVQVKLYLPSNFRTELNGNLQLDHRNR